MANPKILSCNEADKAYKAFLETQTNVYLRSVLSQNVRYDSVVAAIILIERIYPEIKSKKVLTPSEVKHFAREIRDVQQHVTTQDFRCLLGCNEKEDFCNKCLQQLTYIHECIEKFRFISTTLTELTLEHSISLPR